MNNTENETNGLTTKVCLPATGQPLLLHKSIEALVGTFSALTCLQSKHIFY